MKKYIYIFMVICACLIVYVFYPVSYLEPNYHIKVESIGYDLSQGYMGLKVYEVKKALFLSLDDAKYDDETQKAVYQFQQNHYLPSTGIVNLETWKALGLNEDDWYHLENYVTPCQVTPESSREERIETMIQVAESYIGTTYVVGASGKPQTGVDCSGLIIQVMYSIGLDPKPISPVRHSHPDYEYESYSLSKHAHIRHYSWEDREKGDIIFFMNKKGRVNHVGLYVGNDEIIEAISKGVVKRKITEERIQKIKDVGRLL